VRRSLRIAAVFISWFLFLSTLVCSAQDPCLTLRVPVWTNNQIQLTFLGEYNRNYVVESSDDFQNWLPIATNSDFCVTRVILVGTLKKANFYRAGLTAHTHTLAGLVVKEGVSFKGNNINIDAYDSADTAHFPNGLWNSTNAFAGCNVTTAEGLLDVGNAAIHGRLLLAPGANYALGVHGLVGDIPTNWPAQTGVQAADWVCSNYYFDLPDVFAPYTSGLAPNLGTGTNSYVLGSGSYYVNGNFLVNQNLQVNGVATLYVTGNFTAGSLTISPGATLRLYLGQSIGSSSATFGHIDNWGNAFNLQFFGLPTCTSITLAGENGYLGTIYAPEATLTVNVANNLPFNYQGACVANSAVVNGDFNYHFDHNLSR